MNQKKQSKKPINPHQLKSLAKKNGWNCWRDDEEDKWPNGVKAFLLEYSDCWIHYITGDSRQIHEIYENEKDTIESFARHDGLTTFLCSDENCDYCSCDSGNGYDVVSKIGNTVMFAYTELGIEANIVKEFLNIAGYYVEDSNAVPTSSDMISEDKRENKEYFVRCYGDNWLTLQFQEFDLCPFVVGEDIRSLKESGLHPVVIVTEQWMLDYFVECDSNELENDYVDFDYDKRSKEQIYSRLLNDKQISSAILIDKNSDLELTMRELTLDFCEDEWGVESIELSDMVKSVCSIVHQEIDGKLEIQKIQERCNEMLHVSYDLFIEMYYAIQDRECGSNVRILDGDKMVSALDLCDYPYDIVKIFSAYLKLTMLAIKNGVKRSEQYAIAYKDDEWLMLPANDGSKALIIGESIDAIRWLINAVQQRDGDKYSEFKYKMVSKQQIYDYVAANSEYLGAKIATNDYEVKFIMSDVIETWNVNI